jgi:hypothetical protein
VPVHDFELVRKLIFSGAKTVCFDSVFVNLPQLPKFLSLLLTLGEISAHEKLRAILDDRRLAPV